MYCDLRVRPSSVEDWRLSIQSLGAGPKMYRSDVKTLAVSGEAGVPYKNPYRIKPAVTEELKKPLKALLGDPENPAETRLLMTNTDVLLLYDGRVPSNGKSLMAFVKKACSKHKGFFATRPGTLSLIYDNKEFLSGFAQAKRSSGKSIFSSSSFLPQPVESLIIVGHKELNFPVKERQYVDLPGDSRDRAWMKLKLRLETTRCMSRVSAAIFEKILTGTAGATGAASPDDENSASEPESLLEAGAGHDLFPWEADESQLQEAYCLLEPATGGAGTAKIVDFAAGYSAAIAAIREKRSYVGFVASELIRTVMLEGLLLEITLALQAQAVGFRRGTRVLTRAASLGGDGQPDQKPGLGKAQDDLANLDEDAKGQEPDEGASAVLSDSGAEEL